MKTKRSFTLLELMVVFALLAIAGGAVLWKMQGQIASKRFTSQIERLQDRLILSQKLAVASASDWKGTLYKDKEEWVFEIASEEKTTKRFSPLRLSCESILFNNQKIEKSFQFEFFSGGKVLPHGTLRFIQKGGKMTLQLPLLFQRDEGTGPGPTPPDRK